MIHERDNDSTNINEHTDKSSNNRKQWGEHNKPRISAMTTTPKIIIMYNNNYNESNNMWQQLTKTTTSTTTIVTTAATAVATATHTHKHFGAGCRRKTSLLFFIKFQFPWGAFVCIQHKILVTASIHWARVYNITFRVYFMVTGTYTLWMPLLTAGCWRFICVFRFTFSSCSVSTRRKMRGYRNM